MNVGNKIASIIFATVCATWLVSFRAPSTAATPACHLSLASALDDCSGCSLGTWTNGLVANEPTPSICTWTPTGVPHDGHCGCVGNLCVPTDTVDAEGNIVISNCWFEWEVTVHCANFFAGNTATSGGAYPDCWNSTPPVAPAVLHELYQSDRETGQCNSSLFYRSITVWVGCHCTDDITPCDLAGTITWSARCGVCFGNCR